MQGRSSHTLETITLVLALGMAGLGGCKKDETRSSQKASEDTKVGEGQSPSTQAEPAPWPTPPAKPGPTTSEGVAPEPELIAPGEVWTPGQPIPPGLPPELANDPNVKGAVRMDGRVMSAQQTVAQKWHEIESASLTVSTELHRTEGKKWDQLGEGTIEFLKKDGKLFCRSYVVSTIQFAPPEPRDDGVEEFLTGQRVLRILNGQYLYTLDERHQGTVAVKRWARPRDVQDVGGIPMLRYMQRVGTTTLEPEETLDGKSVYVFETTIREIDAKMRHYVDKETGLLLKLVSENKREHFKLVATITDVKLGVEFDEDHFTFTPPEGVELRDLTRETPEQPQSSPSDDE